MALAPYNGFSHEERMAADRIQKRAIAAGTLAPQTTCDCCGNTSGLIMRHLEDYTQPLTAILPMCVECHMRLHARFSRPLKWIEHCLKVAAGAKPRPWSNVFSFLQVSKAEQEAVLNVHAWTPDPSKWWEMLTLSRDVSVRVGEEYRAAARARGEHW